ncbi:MAG: hypothetical protein WDO19_11225 [Bacteroidota bacterium]
MIFREIIYRVKPIETIYFGGGTPSLLTVPDLQSLISKLRQNFSLSAQAEITLEANPDDISEEKLKERSGGI